MVSGPHLGLVRVYSLSHSYSADKLDGYQKKKYVCKLLFIFLLGNDVDFGHQEAVNLLSSNHFSEKQIVSDIVPVVLKAIGCETFALYHAFLSVHHTTPHHTTPHPPHHATPTTPTTPHTSHHTHHTTHHTTPHTSHHTTPHHTTPHHHVSHTARYTVRLCMKTFIHTRHLHPLLLHTLPH